MAESILLYRFVSAASAVKMIESKTFRVGRICEFNDPFEWKVGISGIVPEGDALARKVQTSIVDALNLDFGVICFSDTAEDPVLWSHYADHHRGVAFEVDYLVTPALYRVDYSDVRPTLDMNRMLHTPNGMEYAESIIKRMFAQKSRGWSYEREYRVFVDLAGCLESGGHRFTPIPPDFLKRVILGFRCALEPDYVRGLLKSVGLADTTVVQARDCRETYRILC